MGICVQAKQVKSQICLYEQESKRIKMRIILAKMEKTRICQCMSSHFLGVKSRGALANPQKSEFCQYLKCYYCPKMAAGAVYLAKHVCRKALAHWQNRQKRGFASVKPKNDIPEWG